SPPSRKRRFLKEREKAVKKLLTAVAVVGGFVGSALASPLVEMEPNNTIATANFIPPSAYPTGAFALDGSISPRDVDYISFSLSLGDFVGVTLFDYLGTGGDSLLGVYNPAGTLVMTDDDSGPGLFSMLQFTADSAGVWSVAITGHGDTDFDGIGHSQS